MLLRSKQQQLEVRGEVITHRNETCQSLTVIGLKPFHLKERHSPDHQVETHIAVGPVSVFVATEINYVRKVLIVCRAIVVVHIPAGGSNEHVVLCLNRGRHEAIAAATDTAASRLTLKEPLSTIPAVERA